MCDEIRLSVLLTLEIAGGRQAGSLKPQPLYPQEEVPGIH
jgi:hypothetical protein